MTIPSRILATQTGTAASSPPCTAVIELEQHQRGERVEVRDLAEYEVAL